MRGTRRLLFASLVVTALVALVPLSPAGATDPGSESGFVSRINSLRASKGLPALQVDGQLTAKARAWAQTMANAGDIFHSNLPDGISADWQRLGENVGMGPDVDSIHNAFVASPAHYRNLVDPGFRYVGVGVVNANGTLYVSEVFMQSASQPAPSTSTSAAGAPSSQPRVSRSSSGSPSSGSSRSAAAAPAPPPPPPPPPPERLTEVLTRLASFDA